MPQTDDAANWQTWREALRARLHERLALSPVEGQPVRYRLEPPTQHEGYRRHYLEFESTPEVWVPAWLLIPEGLSERVPAVIVVHGHGYGNDELVGLNPDGSERSSPEGLAQDFALSLCRRGLVVLVPEMLGFGRRRTPQAQAEKLPNSCQELSHWGLLLGKPLLGQRVQEVLQSLELLESLPEVQPDRVGIMGFSGGGTIALFAAALCERLHAAVVSGYLSTFKGSILKERHCLCNYLPNILRDAELYDIAALIASRPLLIESGRYDEVFPLAPALEAYEALARAYTVQGAAGGLEHHIFEGGHQVNGARAYDFLWQHLHKP